MQGTLVNSVLGEAGSTRFTPTNSFIGSSGVPMNFNVFQQLQIDSNFYNSEYAEHYMIGAQDSSTNQISEGYMQFNTKGWVRADTICVTVPVTLTYNWRNAANQDPENTDLNAYWKHIKELKIGNQGSNPSLTFTKDRLKWAWHPRFAMLDVFNKIDIKIGNNFQPVQKAFETTPLGLKHLMATHRFGYNVAKAMSYWGLPFSTFGALYLKNQGTSNETRPDYAVVAATANNAPPRMMEYNEETQIEDLVDIPEQSFWLENYCDFLKNVNIAGAKTRNYSYKTYQSVLQKDFRNPTISIPRNGYEFTYERELTLPLQCITSFFREARYLPPDFRMHLTFEKSNFDPVLCFSSAVGEFPGVYLDQLPGLEQTTDVKTGLVLNPTLPSDTNSWYKRFYSFGSDMFGFRPTGTAGFVGTDPNQWPRDNFNITFAGAHPNFTGNGTWGKATTVTTRMTYDPIQVGNTWTAAGTAWHLPLAQYATLPVLNNFQAGTDTSLPTILARLAAAANNAQNDVNNRLSTANVNTLCQMIGSQGLQIAAAQAQNLNECAYSSDSKHFLRDFYIRASVNLSKIRLTYCWNVLKQELQASIATSWLSKPFLYNYESSELHEIPVVTGQSNILANIAINSQRPTTLYFMLLANQNQNWPSAETDFADNSLIMSRLQQYDVNRSFILTKNFTTNATDESTVSTTTGFPVYQGIGSFGRPRYSNNKLAGDENIMKLNEPCSVYRISNAGSAKSNTTEDVLPIQWQNFEIRFSGRTALRFRNDKLVNNTLGNMTMTAYDFITNLEHENSFTRYCSEHVLLNCETIDGQQFNMNSSLNPYLLKCVINPGGLAERGVISALQGSVNIQINIDFTFPLLNQYKIAVIRTNPEQFVFDSDKNASIIQWPAIRNRAGYLLPNITLAP